MMAKKYDWQDVTLVPHPYSVAVCTSEEEFIAASKIAKVPPTGVPKWLMEGAVAQVHELEAEDGLKYLLVTCNFKPEVEGINIAAVFAHEAVHCFQTIASHLCEYKPSKEFEAYAIQMITLTLLTQYQKKIVK